MEDEMGGHVAFLMEMLGTCTILAKNREGEGSRGRF
jgi:hypothetical protein